MEDHLRIKLKNAGRHFKRPKMLIIWKRKENSERVGASSKQRRTILWQQSRVNWLQYGDCNTTNFHSKAIHKKQTNLIKCLQSSASHIATTENQMGNILLNHFQHLFSTEEINLSLLEYIHVNSLSLDHQFLLQIEVTDVEIYTAIKQLGAWKASGPDCKQVSSKITGA